MGLGKINALRKAQGFSIEDLSKRSGVPLGTLSKITAGITKNPNIDTVIAIANALHCTLDDLSDQPQSMPRKVTKEEYKLLDKYHALDLKGKHTINTILDVEYNRCTNNLHFAPIAAHNDDLSDDQLDLMKQDIDEL